MLGPRMPSKVVMKNRVHFYLFYYQMQELYVNQSFCFFVVKVNVEVVTNSEIGMADQMWPGMADKPHPETVTVTLTQRAGEGEDVMLF